MKRAFLTRLLLSTFILSIGFYTILNNSGTAPASLAVALLAAGALAMRFVYSSIKVPRLSPIDVLLLAFLLVSTISVFVNMTSSRNLNLNHLYAHFTVTVLYYFAIRWAIANTPYDAQPLPLLRVLYGSFLLIIVTVIVDYGFLLQGVNIADYLPMEKANRIAGSGVFSRPRGFFVEPTDLGLALNALGPIVMVYLYMTGRRLAFALTFLLFLTIHLLARSAAAFAGLFAGLFVAGLDVLLRTRVRLAVSKKGLLNLAILSVVGTGLFLAFKDIITYNIASMTIKIFSVEQSASSAQRHEAWQDTLERFFDAPNPLIGYGTGYLSARSDSSLSWFLSVLTENGVLGILLVLLMCAVAMLRIAAMRSKLRYGFYIAFVAVAIHLMTNSGFYYPFFWLLLVLVQCKWKGVFATGPDHPQHHAEPAGQPILKPANDAQSVVAS